MTTREYQEYLAGDRYVDFHKNPRAYMPWSDEEDQQLIGDRLDGKSIKEIAAEHGRTYRAIESRLKKLSENYVPKDHKPRDWYDNDEEYQNEIDDKIILTITGEGWAEDKDGYEWRRFCKPDIREWVRI
jgi:hypothetical protein